MIATVPRASGFMGPMCTWYPWSLAGADPSFGPRLIALVVFFGLPAVAFALAFFAFFGGELVIEDWTIDARLRLPRPPWRIVDLIAAALLLCTALLALAVAAHGITD